jgi:hypothetical protein
MTHLKKTLSTVTCALLLVAIGCASSSKTESNPLVGWTFHPFNQFALSSSQHRHYIDSAVAEDCRNFIAKNNLLVRNSISGIYEDGTGKQAVDFVGFSVNKSESWHYVLIYNQFHKRIKVVQYDQHKYAS